MAPRAERARLAAVALGAAPAVLAGQRVRIAPPAPEWLGDCSRCGDDYLLVPAAADHLPVETPR